MKMKNLLLLITATLLANNANAQWQSNGPFGGTIICLATSGATVVAGIPFSGVWVRALADITSGIQETPPVAKTDFRLYPNPANGSFIVETTATEKQLLQVFDITGKLMLTQNIQNSQTTIDAGNLASGIYIVSLKGTGATTNEKIGYN